MTKAELTTLRDHADAVLKIAAATPDNWSAHSDAATVAKDRDRIINISLEYFLKQMPGSPLRIFKDGIK